MCTGLLPCHTSSPKPYSKMDGCIYQDSPKASEQVNLQRCVSMQSMDAAWGGDKEARLLRTALQAGAGS